MTDRTRTQAWPIGGVDKGRADHGRRGTSGRADLSSSCLELRAGCLRSGSGAPDLRESTIGLHSERSRISREAGRLDAWLQLDLAARPPSGVRLDELAQPEEMRERLRQERALCDRLGRAFAVLVFESADPARDPRTTRRVVGVLQRCLRASDEIGWLDGGRIGVLLPATSLHDARELAAAIGCEITPRSRARVEVLAYPPLQEVESAQEREPGAAPAACSARCEHAPSAGGVPLAQLLGTPSVPACKRLLDVAGALVGLLVFAPLLALAALLVRFSSPGPILFRQVRAGRNGRPFVLLKFRTMLDGSDALKASLRAFNEQTGPVFKMRNDPRVTKIGRFLRVTSIDELPQLWNVLRGEMSLVGPRPPTPDEVACYEGWQRRRLCVTPGLTCIWQVSGRSKIGFAEWVRMDLRYIQRVSMLLDLRLLARTIPAVLSRCGAQ